MFLKLKKDAEGKELVYVAPRRIVYMAESTGIDQKTYTNLYVSSGNGLQKISVAATPDEIMLRAGELASQGKA